MSPARKFSIAIVMDPISAINPKKDSTVAIIRSAHKAGAQCYYMGIDDLFVEGDEAKALAGAINLTDDPENWCALGVQEKRALAGFDAVLMRKDPPVDKRFIHACHMLEHAVRNGANVINDPTALIGLNEKLFASYFPHLCPPTLVASNLDMLRDFLTRHKKIIVKPLDAMGGTGVFMVTDSDVNFEVIWELQTANGTYPVIAQAFLPEIAAGDSRVIVINGRPFHHALVRTPKQGSIRGNMAAGGATHVRALSETEREIAAEVGETLVRRGILFAGLDIIGDRLIEINITSPTGLRQISDESGVEVSDLIVAEILRHG